MYIFRRADIPYDNSISEEDEKAYEDQVVIDNKTQDPEKSFVFHAKLQIPSEESWSTVSLRYPDLIAVCLDWNIMIFNVVEKRLQDRFSLTGNLVWYK